MVAEALLVILHWCFSFGVHTSVGGVIVRCFKISDLNSAMFATLHVKDFGNIFPYF